MGKINFNDLYKDRLKQIETDKSKAVNEKRWTDVAKLMDEKGRLEKLINETQ